MSLRTAFAAATAAVLLATPVLAGDMTIRVEDAYARSSNPMAGAAFMTLTNEAGQEDRLIAASSDIAKRVELHTHIENADGVMRMVEVEDGFAVPADGKHRLKRGGDHVMFMGLNRAMEQGDTVTVTLTFEKAGDMTVEIPVDLDRTDGHAHGHDPDS